MNLQTNNAHVRWSPLYFCLFAVIHWSASAQTNSTDTERLFVPQSQIEDFGDQSGAAPSSIPRPIIPLGVGIIMDFEGWRPAAYNDPVGYCTIGYGHLIALKRCENVGLGDFSQPLSKPKGAELLEIDTQSSRSAVQKLTNIELTEYQFSALASFAFNVGKGKFAKSTLLKLVNDQNHELAAREFNRWTKAGGIVYKGLKDRRSCESALYLNLLKGDKDQRFRRGECEAQPGAAPSGGEAIDILVGE